MHESDSTLHTRPSLLVRVRDAQDADSWRDFVDTYAPLIYRYCRRCGLQDADAADVGQEVLARVTGAIRRFEYQPERGRFRDWLGTITRNAVRRFLGRRPRDTAAGGEDADEQLAQFAVEIDSTWDADFNARIVEVALERACPHFEPTTWRAFEMAWREQRPAAEVATALGLPLDAVYVAKSRGLKRLREEVLLLAEDLPGLT